MWGYGCKVRPLQIGGAHTCACGPKSGRARCVHVTQKMVATHALYLITKIISNTFTLKRIELPVICHTHNTPTSFCISHKNRWNTRVHPELFSWILICLLWTCLTMLNTTPTYLFLDLWHIKPRLYCLAKWYLKLTTLKSVF